MKMVTVREFRANPGRSLNGGKKAEDVVLTNNGKPVALLWPVNEGNLEDSLKMARRARFDLAVHNIRMQAARNGLDKLTMGEINAIVEEVRSEERGKRKKAA